MTDHGATYEFEPGERVLWFSRLHPTSVPAVVLRRVQSSGAYRVLVNDGSGRLMEQVAGADEMGLRHEYLALDAAAWNYIQKAGNEITPESPAGLTEPAE